MKIGSTLLSLVSVGTFLAAPSFGQSFKGQSRGKRLLNEKKGKKEGGKGGKGMKEPEEDDMPVSLNIILSNDDGFETPLIQSLFDALVDAGHNVVMSAPYGARSGTSGLIEFLVPLSATTEDSPLGTIAAGSSAIGETTIRDNQYYVDGAVTSAVLYGVDVLAPRYFGGFPDLVLMGPNEGQNTGFITAHSGTVGGTVAALSKNIPAIALSAGSDEEQTDVIGDLTVMLIDNLLESGTFETLGNGIGLNVNFPDLDEDTTAYDYSFKQTQMGTAALVGLQFFEKLSDCDFAAGFGVDVDLPGMCLVAPYFAGGSGYVEDTDPLSEFNLINNGMRQIAISVMQATYQASPEATKMVEKKLKYFA